MSAGHLATDILTLASTHPERAAGVIGGESVSYVSSGGGAGRAVALIPRAHPSPGKEAVTFSTEVPADHACGVHDERAHLVDCRDGLAGRLDQPQVHPKYYSSHRAQRRLLPRNTAGQVTKRRLIAPTND
jgi:hypothetical protein